jgi:hypothetical protein
MSRTDPLLKAPLEDDREIGPTHHPEEMGRVGSPSTPIAAISEAVGQ